LTSATTGEIPAAYFEAFAESSEEGQALWNLHQSRAAWARQQAERSGPQVDGG
jgi:hypothetical protein